MKKIMIMLAGLCLGTLTSFGQARPSSTPAPVAKDSVDYDKSFEDAGEAPGESSGYHLSPKFYKAGDLVPEQPIALSTAKEEAIKLARQRPTPLRRDCLNIIYTVNPVYSQGTITGAVKGTITIRWNPKKRSWAFSYLKYQLLNIEQNTQVFRPELE